MGGAVKISVGAVARLVLMPLPLFFFFVSISGRASAADEKIDPPSYICAELVASSIDGQPPVYEGLQLDGYAAAKSGVTVADAETLPDMLIAVIDACSPKPGDKALERWREIREDYPVPDDGPWRADKTRCGDYAANPDDGSGFVIWLDAYNRGKTGKPESVFADQATLDRFLEVCKQNPDRLMLDVLAENAR